MIYACCRPRRLEAVRARGAPQRDRVRRGVRLRGAGERPGPAGGSGSGPCSSDCSGRRRPAATPSDRGQRVDHRWRADPDGGGVVGRAGPSLPPGEDARTSSPGSTTRQPSSWSGPVSAATSRPTRSGWWPAPPTPGLRPASTRCWSRSTSPSRSSARPTSTAASTTRAHRRPSTVPAIDYLAKDYDTFRRLMLDRLSLTTPGWDERNPAELGMALVEVLAYLADELSLPPGRGRDRGLPGHGPAASVAAAAGPPGRLHGARGQSNARAWVRLRVDANNVAAPRRPSVLTRVRGLLERRTGTAADSSRSLGADLGTAARCRGWSSSRSTARRSPLLHESLNALDLYTWGDIGCCLPAGATTATLPGHHATRAAPRPRAGPGRKRSRRSRTGTGTVDDADPSHRWRGPTHVGDRRRPTSRVGLFDDPPTNGLPSR